MIHTILNLAYPKEHIYYILLTYGIISLCHIQVHLSRNCIPTVISSPNYTSLPSMVATFLATHLIVVLQPSGYSVFHSRDTPIQLSLL